ncbi:hypothetical protein RHMOL_Rhmol07G0035200 [Rhododendron molle]|uniref:Uncharacterized protein n=1 Tax=Rhododendron molle TaxID=49168 RepID=A0ACC0MYL5_RHOML|nr:hypothetical protein RHMOL_Rhmol07G0035200 [Rhododendron molle]
MQKFEKRKTKRKQATGTPDFVIEGLDCTWKICHYWLSVMSSTNYHSLKLLLATRPTRSRLNNPLIIIPRVEPLNSDNFGLEPDQLSESEFPREILHELEHLLVSGEIPRIPINPIGKRVVRETHEVSGQVGSERGVEAAVDDLPFWVEAQWIGLDTRIVDPCSTGLV